MKYLILKVKWSECWKPNTGIIGGFMFGTLLWVSVYIILFIYRWLTT